MKTRDRILSMARQLFNEEGVNQVSAKAIAARLNISDGNLRYHFRTKEDIIYGLYQALVEQLNQQFDQYRQRISLSGMFQALHFTFTQFEQYRFLLLNFTDIMRQYATIRNHYQQLYQARQQQFLGAVKQLIGAGIFREEISEQQYKHLMAHFNIVSDFWLAHAEILYRGQGNQLTHFTHLTFSLVVPYLTEAGLREYDQLPNLPEDSHLASIKRL